MNKGHFTLPGESGYEELTLNLAKRWGADVIRDCDGTQLSDSLLNAGYGIYSTICIIRDHNEWIKNNMHTRQQCFLSTEPETAVSEELCINIMSGFFDGQMSVNENALDLMQVYDRTTGTALDNDRFSYDPKTTTVKIKATPFHTYTVGFLAWRNWEEISMYNHTTNNWQKERLMQLDPYYPEALEYISVWLENWCIEHPRTTVVRFTSMFYNFAWIWGSSEARRNIFTDWASYDFTVSERALRDFKKKYGYSLTCEDFVNGGKYHVTHMLPTRQKLDWMEFIEEFVRSAGKRLIDIVHKYGKKAYVFYDDSWVGVEPYGDKFTEFGFDGIIKCVFSGYEARLCAGVKADTHEIRLHPYLFPVGLGGAPTFSEGGTPDIDARRYWVNVRRALLRQPVDRIGLGGYLHYAGEFPKFADAIEDISKEFETIRSLHLADTPVKLKKRVGVLTAWGRLRSWTLSGHFHETYKHVLIHIIESLSGMPVDVEFLSFDDVKNGKLDGIDVLINAGRANSAWSGGEMWNDALVIENVAKFAYNGGTFIGIGEPSACAGADRYFRMANVLGVDLDTGERCCHGKWPTEACSHTVIEGISGNENIYLTDPETRVLMADDDKKPVITSHTFGSGKGIYMAGYSHTPRNARLLLDIIAGDAASALSPADVMTECAVFEGARKLVFVNNSEADVQTSFSYNGKSYSCMLAPFGIKVIDMEQR